MKKEALILSIILLISLVLPIVFAQSCDYEPLCEGTTQSCGCGGVQSRVTACQGGCTDWSQCTQPTTETGCNDGTDDDCDGLIDCDDQDCIQSNFCIDADNDGYPAANDCNDLNPDVNPGAEEICNNRDDNCNTLADENLEQECGQSLVGVCTLGTETCSNGAWTGCTAILPQQEICDGADNDCDGELDEGCACETGESRQCGETDIGRCEYGQQECTAGQWGPCIGLIIPTKEQCDNNLDDDCDGTTDEDCQLPSPQQPVPPESPQQPAQPESPQQPTTQTTTPTPQAEPKGEPIIPSRPCIDADNDGYGLDCKAGADCDDTDPNIYFNAKEICDGKDNNCNLRIDEGLTRPCGTNVGICREGFEQCRNGEWTDCNAVTGKEERCGNYLDDDCDGIIDENCSTQEDQKQELLLKAFLDQEFGADNYDLNDVLEAYRQTKDEFAIDKSSEIKEGKTEITVRVKINKAMKDVTIYEFIPKDVVQSTDHITFSKEPKIITKDPLVAWHFDELTDDTEIKYKIEGEHKEAHKMTETIALSYAAPEKTPWYILMLPLILVPAVGFMFVLLVQLSKKHGKE